MSFHVIFLSGGYRWKLKKSDLLSFISFESVESMDRTMRLDGPTGIGTNGGEYYVLNSGDKFTIWPTGQIHSKTQVL